MKLHKWVAYLLLITLLALPFIAYRLYWLGTSVKTGAVVAYVDKVHIRRSAQFQPFFRYEADRYVVTAGGNYNLPYQQGDRVSIRYNPRNITNFKIDTVWGCWKDLLYWSAFPFIFITMIFAVGNTIPQTVYISFKTRKDDGLNDAANTSLQL